MIVEIVKQFFQDIPVNIKPKAPVLITLKEHTENFISKHSCCLIKPCKSEHGKISKIIIEVTNSLLQEKLDLNY